MIVEVAQITDAAAVARLDRHISPARLTECLRQGFIYVLRNDVGDVIGVLRYSLFWQMFPFLDLLFLDEAYRRQGLGTVLMRHWEEALQQQGYAEALLSTQADETAWRFYEKRGYTRVGSFLPPQQETPEWMYTKSLNRPLE